MKTSKLILGLSVIGLLWLGACKDDNNESSSSSRAEVSMVDAPGAYDAVVVDVQSISILSGASSSARAESFMPDFHCALLGDKDDNVKGSDLVSGL